MQVSIIIPVLNESRLIAGFLRHLRSVAPGAEIIVADGGSNDETVDLSNGLADRVIITSPGRGRQMNAGAAVAGGEVFWFVHADSHIPAEALDAIEGALQDQRTVGGCFRLRLIPRRWTYRLRDLIGDACVSLFHIGLGDRGLFCRRESFHVLRGYSEKQLFEDADLYRALAATGRMRRLDSAIETSARRYEAQGPVRTCLFYGLVMLLYWGGTRRPILECMVDRFGYRANQATQMHASTHLSRSDATERILSHTTPLQFNPNL